MASPDFAGRRSDQLPHRVPDLVIAVNVAEQVLNVASANEILTHIVTHSPAPSPRSAADMSTGLEAPARESNVIGFYRADGAILHLVVVHGWHELDLIPSGRRIEIEQLRAIIQAVIDAQMIRIAEQPLGTLHLHPPTAEDWAGYLAETQGLITGTSATYVDGPDPFDRRGWFHNTFVHGGNP